MFPGFQFYGPGARCGWSQGPFGMERHRGMGRRGCGPPGRRFCPPMMFDFAHGMSDGGHREFEDLGSEYRLVLQVGELSAEDITTEIKGRLLSVRGGKKEGSDADTELDLTCEISPNVNCDCILAELQKGVLAIVFPKAEPRVVAITTLEEEKKDLEPEQWELNDFGSEYRVSHKTLGALIDDISVEIEDGKFFVASTMPGSQWAGTFSLPPDAPVDAVFANVVDGELTIVFPKYKGKRIAVVTRGSGSNSQQQTQPQQQGTGEGSGSQEQEWVDVVSKPGGQ